jgi:hypothetical protein
LENGTYRDIDGVPRVYYDGYWIKRYDPPADTWAAKKQLIDALTRRLFNHTEHGINIPGRRLDAAREAYDAETDPATKRVKGAMLAGALFNRAADIFTHLVELEACGVHIASNNDLMRECGRCLTEALEFGRNVHHRSGDEGIDELWGEPFKAFTMPIDAFYQSRYIKIAMTMRAIDALTASLSGCLGKNPMFAGVDDSIEAFAVAARRKCETLRTDPDIFEVWPDFVVSAEKLENFVPQLPAKPAPEDVELAQQGEVLIQKCVQLVSDITRARTPMPKSGQEFVALCKSHAAAMSNPTAA